MKKKEEEIAERTNEGKSLDLNLDCFFFFFLSRFG